MTYNNKPQTINKMVIRTYIRLDTIKLLEENIGRALFEIGRAHV